VPTFVAEDMPMLLMANAGVLTATTDAAPDAWRRLVGYFLQACATARRCRYTSRICSIIRSR
jgi:hypothetical protein